MTQKPMNKFLKIILWIIGGFVGLVVLLLAAAAIIIPIKYPPEKLKAMATEKLTETLHHQVAVKDVRFNILSGFKIQGLKVANRAGWDPTPIVDAKEISISYQLFPLLWGQVKLDEVVLDRPEIFIERRGMDSFNFSDMTASTSSAVPAAAPAAQASVAAKKPAAKPKAKPKPKSKKKAKPHAGLPSETRPDAFGSLFVASAYADDGTASKPADKASKTTLLLTVGNAKIVHGKMTYLDRSVNPPQKYLLSDLNLHIENISMVGGKSNFTMSTPVEANNQKYQFSLKGTYRFLMASSMIKDMDIEGILNDSHSFQVKGDLSYGDGIAPKLDGDASLDSLKLVDLIPRNLAKMPQGLVLKGPARVDFHLEGNTKAGLELDGSADGSSLAIQFKDYFIKTDKTTCKVEFKSLNRMAQGIYDIPSFKIHYQDWDVNGSFHYQSNGLYSGSVHSKSLPFQGLPGMFPKLKNTTVNGSGAMDIDFSQVLGKPESLKVNGLVSLKGVGIILPKQEPYLEDITGPIYLNGQVLRVPKATFKSFDGTGAAGVTWNYVNDGYTYGFVLKDVSAQKAIDASIDAYVTTKDFTDYKDKLLGNLNLSYAGSGRGFGGDQMIASALGNGSYTLDHAKVKDLALVKAINKYFKDSSNEIAFDQIKGVLVMKNKVFTYTADTNGKVGAVRERGGINVAEMVYAPDMTVQADVKKDFLNSDAVLAGLPGEVRGLVKNVDWFADGNGNIPIDFKFTGPVKQNNYAYDWDRLKKNVGDHAAQEAKKAVGDAAKPVLNDIGNKLKGLFGK
ncbi:MAG TPA: AsmA family protein [bacterium]|nr:AsmA family protein [bacterium]